MVYQFTFGDRFKSESEKKELQEAQIKKYQDLFITDKTNEKALAIKNTYPTLSTGMISSLINTDATKEDVNNAIIDQTKINAQRNSNYSPVNEEYVPDVNSLMLGKAFGTVSQGIKAGTDEFLSSAKRTLKFALQLAEAGFEELITRGARTNIILTGELEEELQRQGLTEKESKRLGVVYNVSGVLTPVEADRRALTNALGKIITRKEFGVPDTFNDQKIQKVRQQAGGGSLEQALRLISEGQELNSDDFIKNIPTLYKKLGVRGVAEAYDAVTGEGIISAGPAVDIANQIKESNLYNNRNITSGRYVSDILGIENERADFWVSGLIDAAILMALDPVNLLGKSAKGLKEANKILEKIKKLQKADKVDDALELARTFIKEETSKDVIDFIISDNSPDKFIKLVKANKDPIFALNLYNSKSADDVYNAYEEAVLRGTNWNTPSMNGTKMIPDWLNNSAYKFMRNKQTTASADDPISSLGSFIPDQEVNLEDATQTLDAFINFATIAKVEKGFANKVALDLTKAIQSNRYGQAQKILVKDFYGHIVKKYAKNNDTVSSYNVWAEKTLQKFRGQDVAYTVGQGPESRAIQRTGYGAGKKFVEDIPWSYQTMSRTFYFTPFRTVKRTVNTIDQVTSRSISKMQKYVDPDTSFGKFLKDTNLKVEDLDLSLPKQFADVSDFLWNRQMDWSTAMLPTRLAYPIRLTLEGLLRGYLYGMDSLNNPAAYIEYLYHIDEDILGRAFKEGSWSNRQMQGLLDEALGTGRVKVAGPKAINKAIRENFSTKNYYDTIFEDTEYGKNLMKKAVESLRIQYSNMWQDDITKLLAEYTTQNKPLKELAERFWNGDQKNLWNDYIASLDETDIVTESLDDVLKELQAYQDHVISLTGGNRELLESFVTGKYKNIDMRSFDRKRSENIKTVTDGIEDMLRTSGNNRPVQIPTPDDLWKTDNFNDWLKEQGRKGFQSWQDAAWYFASSMEANAIRIPFYKQFYFRSIAADIIIADEKALNNLVGRINKLPKTLQRELKELYPILKNSKSQIKKIVNNNNLPKISLEAMDLRAQTFAKLESDRIFYNLSKKGNAADALRFVFPFFEAFKEVAFSLTKGIYQKPSVLTKGTHAIKTGRKEGIIYKDPLTQDDYVAVPMPGFVANRVLGAGADKLKPYVTVPLSGFNLVGATLLPGVGPVVGLAIDLFSGQLKKIFNRDVYKIIVPYGTPIEDVEELAPSNIATVLGNIYVPSYLKSLLSGGEIALTGELQSLFQQDSVSSRGLEQVKIVSSNTPTPLQTEKEFEDFDKKVIDGTAARMFVEGILKYMAPSPPRLLYQTEFDYTAKNVDEKLKPFVDAVIGDMDLGKVTTEDAKHYVGIGVLALFYSDLQKDLVQEYGETDGPYYAWLAFTQMTGIQDISDISSVVAAALSKEGKYQQLEGKLPKTKEELTFKLENPEIVEKYSETYLYLMTGIQEKGELESTLFFEQLKKDEIEAIDPVFMVIEAAEFLFNICYENGTKMYRGSNSEIAQRERNRVLNFCTENFPLGTGDTELNYRKLTGRDVKEPKDFASRWATKLNELEEMAKDPSLKDYVVYPALQSYFLARDISLRNIAINSKTLNFPQDKKKLERQIRTGTSDVAQQEREKLREVANNLLSNIPEFYTAYDEVLSFEIQYNKRYKVGR